MANFLAMLYHVDTKKNSLDYAARSSRCHKTGQPLLASKFKYQANSCQRDIDEIRRLVTLEQGHLSPEELQFWRPDYERLIEDDWLVSRFLLRGLKFAQSGTRQSEETEQQLPALYAGTINLIRLCAKFRYEHQINAHTQDAEFPSSWISVNGVFDYKPDLAGNSTLYMRVSLHKPKLIDSSEMRYLFKRLLLYNLDRCDRDLFNRPGKGICCVFDMSEATLENVDFELMSWMLKSFKSFSPKLLCYVIVYNLPWLFSATLKLITGTLLSKSSKQSLRFVYGSEILGYIGRDNLPIYLRASV